MSIAEVLTGALGGVGCFLAVEALFPAPARLGPALARLSASGTAGPPATIRNRLARQLLTAAPWLPVPATDLRLLGLDTETWMARKITYGLLGLALPACLATLLVVAGMRASWPVPAVAALATGLALFLAPDVTVRRRAAERRAEFRYALTSFGDLVALKRAGGAGPTEALESAADLGGGWPFERIRGALRAARYSRDEPWAALAALAGQIGVPELTELASITETAGQEGAQVLDTLMACVAAMRAKALAAARAAAVSRTTTMSVPLALLATAFLVLIAFPALYQGFVTG
jgi:Flp pilus assembly protein TadB